LATFTINPGVTEAELQLTLDRPALGMLLRPIETLDRFRIDELRLQPLSLWRRLRHIPADPSDLAERVHPRQPLPAMRRQDDESPEIAFEGEPTLDWSIIIPTINELELVCQCVRSCRRYLPRDASIEFIVVDDGTRDAALRHALTAAGAEHGFQVHFTLQNLGFSAAVNLGMRHSKGRCLVLCNNDIQFFQPWLEPLRQCLTDHPQVGVVGARLLYPDGRIQHAGMTKLPDQLGWVHRYKDLSADHGPANRSEDVWSVTGALLALRREAVVQLGGLSNAYAMAYEDIDYCLHAWANGWGVRYEPEVAAYHLEGATRGTSPQERWTRPWLWVERDRLARSYFERKWRALHDVNRLQDFVDLCSCEEANALR
jgi:GT2 family glycosyltransferase